MTEGAETTSKYRGVAFHKYKDGGKWRATLNHDYVVYNIGEYDDEKAAAKAYNLKAKEILGEQAVLNTIEGEETIVVPEKRKVTSSYKGVSWHKASNRWRSSIRHNKKQYELGRYKTELEAYEAFKEKALELGVSTT